MFEKVSKEEWEKSVKKFEEKYNIEIKEEEKEIVKEPKRSTIGSAGYDFIMPFSFTVNQNKEYLVPTGYKWNPENTITITQGKISPTYDFKIKSIVLMLYPRSSLGFKYGFQLLNTTGVIDMDYYNNISNEGHIFVGFKTKQDVEFKRGDKFCQGVIIPYGFDEKEYNNLEKLEERKGGMGSTD